MSARPEEIAIGRGRREEELLAHIDDLRIDGDGVLTGGCESAAAMMQLDGAGAVSVASGVVATSVIDSANIAMTGSCGNGFARAAA